MEREKECRNKGSLGREREEKIGQQEVEVEKPEKKRVKKKNKVINCSGNEEKRRIIQKREGERKKSNEEM